MRFISLLAVIGAISASCTTAPTVSEEPHLIEIIDGDTITVDLEGRRDRVRLVGINSPEQAECYAAEATAALTAALATGSLRLEVTGGDDRDRFGRLLRYVYIDERLVNLDLVENGHALALNSDHRMRAEFRTASIQAWMSRVGLWSAGACGDPAVAAIEISSVEANPPGDDAERPNDEYVEILNRGSAVVDLSGWKVRDESSSNRYEFPMGLQIEAGAAITLHSGCGTDTRVSVYWCAGPVWSNNGDTVILQSPNGMIVHAKFYDAA